MNNIEFSKKFTTLVSEYLIDNKGIILQEKWCFFITILEEMKYQLWKKQTEQLCKNRLKKPIGDEE